MSSWWIIIIHIHISTVFQELLERTGDTDEEILKRMEEILFTYKCKVEDKLAAEGKQLPKVRIGNNNNEPQTSSFVH